MSLTAALLFAGTVFAPPVPPDLAACPAIDRPAPAPSRTAPAGAARLSGFAELDRLATGTSCPPKPLLRAWSDARRRLAPFLREPDPDWRTRAAEAARLLPATSPSTIAPDPPRCPVPLPAGDWASLGPTNIAGRINALVIDPRDESVVFAAAASGGVWKTTDAGESWRVLTDRLPSIAAGDLLLDRTAPDTLWFGTGEGPPPVSGFVPGTGVYRSTDGGESWERRGESRNRQVMRLATLPGNPPAIFVAGERGIERSIDDGATWQLVLEGGASDVASEPGSADAIWAALGWVLGDAANGIYRSTDRGVSWTRAAGGAPAGESCGRITLAVSPVDPKIVWAGVQDATDAGFLGLLGLWKSTDAGSSWAKMARAPDYCSYPPPYDMYKQCFYNNALLAHPTRPGGLYMGGIEIYRTFDGGEAFLRLMEWARSNVHTDQHAFAVAPSGALWVGNDGGVYRSTDEGRSWIDRGMGLVTTQFYGLASFPGREDLLFGGLQDNGSLRRRGDPPQWKFVLGGDGGPSAIDPRDPNVLYGQSWSLDLFKSTNGGASWTPATTGIPVSERTSYRTQFIAPLVMDAANPSTLLAATWRVWRSVDGAGRWAPISGDLAETEYDGVSAVAFGARGDPSLWAGTSNGRVWVTRSGLSTDWVEVTKEPLPPGRFLERIAVDPSDPNRVWLGYGSDDASNVYRSTDGGNSWAEAGPGLPAAPALAFAIDPEDGRRVWVGTEVGLLFTNDGGGRWFRWGGDFPAARVDDIVFDPLLRRLRVGTHGRGVWDVSADEWNGGCRESREAR